MANIFLDANILVSILEKRYSVEHFTQHSVFISPLSIHIYIYIKKISIPSEDIQKIFESFSIVPFNENVSTKAFIGPTKNYEDNVQLHSAVESNCQYFITHDKELLRLGVFGQTRILNNLP